MKKTAALLFFILSLIFTGCSKNYDEARLILIDDTVYLNNFIEALEQVDESQDFVVAIDEYRDTLTKFIPRFRAILNKYPELKGLQEENMPGDLKFYHKKKKLLLLRMRSAMMKMRRYAAEPEVAAALKRFYDTMSVLNEYETDYVFPILE